MQTVENANDALFQGRAAYNAVINDDQVVFAGHKATISNVVHMCGQVISCIAFGNEGTELDIFDGNLFASDALRKDFLQLLMVWLVS